MADSAPLDDTINKVLSLPRLQRYEVGEEIDRGGLGIEYRAKNKEKNNDVILKLMLHEKDPVGQERFRQEALTLNQLSHPNIVNITDYGIEKSVHFLAFKEIKGKTLGEVTRASHEEGKTPDYAMIQSAMLEVAKAVAAIHRKGILHRDIKPDSIILEHGSNRPVLTEFCLVGAPKVEAPDLQSFLQKLTSHGYSTVTPAYMSPEQLDPKGKHGKLGNHTDIWALGATLYYCLTARVPHADKGSGLELLEARLNSNPTPAKDLNDAVPQRLSNLCQQCLCLDATQRPSIDVVIRRLSQETQNDFKRFKAEGERVTSRPTLKILAVLGLILLFGGAYFLKPGPETQIDGRSLKAWTQDLQSENDSRVEKAATAFIGSPKIAVPHLVQLAKNKDQELSYRAIIVLGRMGVAARQALPELKQIKDANPDNKLLVGRIERAMQAIEGKK